MRIHSITKITQVGESLTVEFLSTSGARLELPCDYIPLIEWLHEVSEEKAVRLLNKYPIELTIGGGRIVEIVANRRGKSRWKKHLEPRSSSQDEGVTPETAADPLSLEQKLRRREATHLHDLSQTRRSELEVERSIQREDRLERRSKRNSTQDHRHGGIRFCPHCKKPVQTIVFHEASKTIYRCSVCEGITAYS